MRIDSPAHKAWNITSVCRTEISPVVRLQRAPSPGFRKCSSPVDCTATEPEISPALSAALCWLEEYFRGKEPTIKVKLAPEGTPFQKRVWEELLTIPYGETLSYGELARRLGSSPRAVGSAVGRNPISLLIPCHRVLGSDGSLTGYAGGIERKKFLLEQEKTAKY